MPTGVYTRIAGKSYTSKGQHLSVAHKKKLSAALIGKSIKWLTGRKASATTRTKMSEARLGEKHPQFIHGVPKPYRILHYRIKDLYGKANHCEFKDCTGKSKRFQWSNKNHKYDSMKREDWQQACVSCHKKHDKQLKAKGE
jgi:hypothetical protein